MRACRLEHTLDQASVNMYMWVESYCEPIKTVLQALHFPATLIRLDCILTGDTLRQRTLN